MLTPSFLLASGATFLPPLAVRFSRLRRRRGAVYKSAVTY